MQRLLSSFADPKHNYRRARAPAYSLRALSAHRGYSTLSSHAHLHTHIRAYAHIHPHIHTCAPTHIHTQVPKAVKPKKVKNIEYDELGNKHGRIHMERQDFGKLQTRKVKGMCAIWLVHARGGDCDGLAACARVEVVKSLSAVFSLRTLWFVQAFDVPYAEGVAWDGAVVSVFWPSMCVSNTEARVGFSFTGNGYC